jgi:hypothetical protein
VDGVGETSGLLLADARKPVVIRSAESYLQLLGGVPGLAQAGLGALAGALDS